MLARFLRSLLLLILLALPATAGAGPNGFRALGWNLQSGDSDPVLLGQQMAAKSGVALWALSEVADRRTLRLLERAVERDGSRYEAILGRSGRGDRLAILYDPGEFDLLEVQELEALQPSVGLRAPLLAQLRARADGTELVFMVNHLARTKAAARREQALGLRRWVQAQTAPVLALGDYNLDFDIVEGDQGKRDAAFDILIDIGGWEWARPAHLVKTQASARYRSILDFALIANLPAGWSVESVILDRSGDRPATALAFADDERQSDHRPVEALVTICCTEVAGLLPPPPRPSVPSEAMAAIALR